MIVRVMGPLEIQGEDGQPCSPRGAKQRLLLSLLLLHAPHPMSSDRLVHCLWGNDLPKDPGGALRTQISRLRSCLADADAPPGAVESGPGGYRLRVEGLEVDLHRFERMLEEARRQITPGEELRCLEEALVLWRGPPWQEFPDVNEFLGPARGLGELHWGARERRVECLLALGRTAEALSAAEFLVREDPIREGSRTLLMQALHTAGRSHEALATSREYRRILSEELGLDPSPALRELEGAILRHEPGAGGAAPPTGPPAGGLSHSSPVQGASPPLRQNIRLCRTPDGVRLAYATVGSGPPLVKAANWLNHLEFDWESPVWRRLFRELAANHTLVRYDERGSGLSDRDPPSQSLEAWVLDLETVVAACGLERFPLLGISQGCAVCIEYAARHPEQVTGLILHGGYAAGWRAAGNYPAPEVARREASIPLVRHGWGEDTPAYREMFTLTFIPGGTREQIEWFNELERRSVSPEGAARFMEAFADLDVRQRLSELRTPTLVLHSRRDQRIDYEVGEELAAGIPGARFVLLESANHLILEHEAAFDPWLSEIRHFLSNELRN